MIMQNLLDRYPQLAACREDIVKAAEAIIAGYEKGGKLLLCGNGGSCADCDHIVGELMKGFLSHRPLSREQKAQMRQRAPLTDESLLDRLQGGLPAISLSSMTALNSALCNDADPALMYAQPLMALGREGDILLALSTSGNALNVCSAAQVAKALGLTVIALTGKTGGRLKTIADIRICVPETETYKIQELHLPIYHALCAAAEKHFFT